jgi:Putative Actinobacterial Holin-X, holin superfamily III
VTKSNVDIEELVVALDQEFEQLRRDAAERAHEAGRGAALVGTAGALGFASVAALGSLPLLALRRVMPAWQIALLVAGGTAAGATVLGRLGLARLAAIAPKALEAEAKEAVEDVADAAR